jgi:hypothetical protein
MLTRRRFLGTVAALAAGSRVAPVAVHLPSGISIVAHDHSIPAGAEVVRVEYVGFGDARRDDGDTLLELR